MVDRRTGVPATPPNTNPELFQFLDATRRLLLKLAQDVVRIDEEDDTAMRFIEEQLAVFSSGNVSSGVFTPTLRNGVFQKLVNAGAHRLTPLRESGMVVIRYLNGAAAGAVTTSDFDKVTGSAFTTTSGHAFICRITVIESWSWLEVQAMQ